MTSDGQTKACVVGLTGTRSGFDPGLVFVGSPPVKRFNSNSRPRWFTLKLFGQVYCFSPCLTFFDTSNAVGRGCMLTQGPPGPDSKYTDQRIFGFSCWARNSSIGFLLPLRMV